MTNARTGRIERVFVNLEAVYPNDNDHNEEMSFEELRAKSRGWISRDWAAESKQRIAEATQIREAEERLSTVASTKETVTVLQRARPKPELQSGSDMQLETTIAVDIGGEGRAGRPKKTKIREVKGETQTSMEKDDPNLNTKLTTCSHDKSRIAYRTKAKAQEICRTHHDSPYQSSHRGHLGYFQSTTEECRSNGWSR